MSAGKALFDTNILLYIVSRADQQKRRRAAALFREYAGSARALVSTQVVQEFHVACTRKLGFRRARSRGLVEALLDLPLVVVSPGVIRSALSIEERYGISFWDSLVIAAAQAGGAETVYTEDLNHGQAYGTVNVRNPFVES